MKPIVIIPARYHSSRFLGKPLALIHGKPMIQRVVEKVKPAVAEVWVATDHEEIASTVREFGGNVVMTSPLHTREPIVVPKPPGSSLPKPTSMWLSMFRGTNLLSHPGKLPN